MVNNLWFDANSNLAERLLEMSPDLIYVLDLKLQKLVFVSNQVTTILGYSQDDIQQMGNSFGSIMVVADMQAFAVDISARFDTLKMGEYTEFLMDFRHKNGQICTLRNRGTVLKQDQDALNQSIIITAENITELLLQEEALKKKQNHLHDAERLFQYGSWEWQVGQETVAWSNGLFELLGMKKEDNPSEIVPRDQYLSFIPEPERSWVAETAYKNIADGVKYYEIEHTAVDANGQTKQLLLRSQLVETNGQLMVIGTASDITLRRDIESELEKQVAALHKSNQDLEQFAYVASHDLQEPLRKIKTFGERLVKKHQAQLDTEGQFFVERMTNAADRMHNLIEDLLKYSRVSWQAEAFETVSVQEIAEKVLEDLEVKIQEKRATVTLQALPSLKVQPTQMHQLLLNLTENALKFAETTRPPTVNICARPATSAEIKRLKLPAASYARLSVSDNGIGFENQYAERIFGIFQRLHGRSEYAGTGLGLAICRKIIYTHHGQIEANSRPGYGSEFACYLPS